MTERVNQSPPDTHQYPQVDISKEAIGKGLLKELYNGIGVLLTIGAGYAVDYALKNPEEARQWTNRIFEIFEIPK